MYFMANEFNKLIGELFNEHAADLDPFGLEPEAKHVEHNSYDGFIPFTNGGWRLMVMNDLSNVWGSGDQYASEAQTDLDRAIEYSLGIALESFIESNSEALAALYGTSDEDKLKKLVSYHDLYEKDQGSLAEELSEAEHSSLTEGGEFWLELRAHYYSGDNHRNETGEDEILFMAGINTDYSYGRDKGLIVTREKTVKLRDLRRLGPAGPDRVRDIVADMVASLES